MNQAEGASGQAGEAEDPDVVAEEPVDEQPSLLPEDDEQPSLLPEDEEEEPEVEEEPEEVEPERPDVEPHIYAIKTTINQENSVAQMIANKADKHGVEVFALLHPAELRGYLLVEALDRLRLEELVRGIPHMRGMVEGETDLEEVQHFLTPKPSVEGIAEGDIVELISGPFKGEKARVQRIDEAKEEITVELFEAMVPIPVTVSGDAVRVLEKQTE